MIIKAVIQTGGKQYLVSVGDVLDVEKLLVTDDKKVIFKEVLMVTDEAGKDIKLGDPLLKDTKVEAEVVSQFKADKIIVFKMKRRKRYRRTQGHRQQLTKIKITKISA